MQVVLQRQTEPGAPFEAWPEATFVLTPDGPGRWRGRVCAPERPEPISAYRLLLDLPFTPEEHPRIHHGAAPRMKKQGSVMVTDDFGEGLRSDLTASYHFDERPGQQSFGFFPALVVLGEESPGWLMGPLTESLTRASFDWSRLANGHVRIEAQFEFWAVHQLHYTWPEGFDGEHFYVEVLTPGLNLEPGQFEGYLEGLEPFVRGRAKQGPNARHELFWGSWNDGILRDIDAGRILDMARWAKANVPNLRWIQVDDGWAGPSELVPGSVENGGETLGMSDLGAFYKPEQLNSDPRFPGGMKALAREIKEIGLRPMIWLTPTVMQDSPAYLENLEWFQPHTRLHFVPEMRFFDLSVPGAREYVRKVFDIVFGEWGFEGCKLDFWSMGFEQRDVRLSQGKATATEWMYWFVETLRSYVGEDGLLLYGIDLPFGSPFRGRLFDQFRYYADSEGSCQSEDAMREQAMWAAYMVGLYQVQRFWIPDGDGLGLFSHFTMPDRHYRRWAAFLLGSGTLTELAGWLHQMEDRTRLKHLKKFAAHARFGSRVTLPGYDYLNAVDEAPTVWVRHDEDSNLVALTNWTSEKLAVAVTPEMVGGFRLRDVLTDKVLNLPARIELGREDGRVFVTV